jgi:hypothetical protein
MSFHQVSCINKRGNHYNPHERISAIGGLNSDNTRWNLPEDEAIKSIENGTYQFFVTANGKTANVVVSIHNGRKYLKTVSDGYSPDNLLSLSECP